jgi:hypothetical protein
MPERALIFTEFGTPSPGRRCQAGPSVGAPRKLVPKSNSNGILNPSYSQHLKFHRVSSVSGSPAIT